MHWQGRTIWDTRIQSVSGFLSAEGETGVEVFFTASFAQVSLDPPLLIVNPNRLYAIESAIRKRRRFAINMLAVSQRIQAITLMRMRRRQPDKAALLGFEVSLDGHNIPFFSNCLRTLFCEVEREIQTGDRNLYVARILESRVHTSFAGERPLLFTEVTTPITRFPTLRKTIRTTAVVTGALDAAKTIVQKVRPPAPANIAKTTFDEAGATEPEIELIHSFGLSDTSRFLSPPAPAIIQKQLGICVVGTGWGSFHCQLVKQANPNAKLFVCGRNPDRTAHLAKAVGADGLFTDLEKAIADPRIQAFSLALPHDLHRSAVEAVAAGGKHALVEKPIATNLDDADAMIQAARNAGTILMVAEDMHFRPSVAEAVKRIEKGDLGEPLYLLVHAGGVRKPSGWAADKNRMGGGVLIDIGVHYIRALRLIMGEPDQVMATRAMQIYTKMSGEDSVQLIFNNRSGWQAHMLLSWATQRGHNPDIVVTGEKGTLHLWPGANFLDYYPVAPRPLTRALSFVRPYWLQAKLTRPTQQRLRIPIPNDGMTGYVNEFKEFMAAVTEGREPATTAEDGRRDLEIVIAAYASLEARAMTDIPPLLS